MSFLFGACEKKKSPSIMEPSTDVEKILEIEWATRMNFEKQIGNLANGVSYEDWYIYSGDFADPPTIMAFNKDNGDKEWEYIHQGVVKDAIDVSYIYQNIYLGLTTNGLIGFDLDTKTNIWEIDFLSLGMERGFNFFQFENYIYFNSVSYLNTIVQEVNLYRLNPATGDLLSVYSNNQTSIGPVALFHDSITNNQNIIFNEYPNVGMSPPVTTQNITRFNISTGDTLWTTRNFTNNFASNGIHPPVIYDNRIVITGGDWHMYAFDIENGDLLWKTSISDDSPFSIFTTTNHLLHEGRLYVNENGENVTCLDPETGAIIWNNPKGGANCTDNMFYYEKEDLLVFTSWGYGSIMALDALTGETIHREHRYDNSSYNNDVIYDVERDKFFTATFKHVVGFTLKRPE